MQKSSIIPSLADKNVALTPSLYDKNVDNLAEVPGTYVKFWQGGPKGLVNPFSTLRQMPFS